MRAANAEKHVWPTFENVEHPTVALERNTDWQTAFYVRMHAVDKPGVLAKVAQTFAQFGVSIAVMQQKGDQDNAGRVTLVFITHQASEKAMREALENIDPNMASVESMLRVEE